MIQSFFVWLLGEQLAFFFWFFVLMTACFGVSALMVDPSLIYDWWKEVRNARK
jgi:hypothetical protein